MTRTAGFTAQDVMDVFHARFLWDRAREILGARNLTLIPVDSMREDGLLPAVQEQYAHGDFARYYNASPH